eukprot:TRINITY_DN63166_c0_g1_i1.p1 TRINITY_DN63166_c0_g1~~TRINITY_DN63166_c0_g1_i1.p1  ORF type:complete len:106 (+),score=7.56 TRINITY_DN63166_c0_g1_i1:33-350(+)
MEMSSLWQTTLSPPINCNKHPLQYGTVHASIQRHRQHHSKCGERTAKQRIGSSFSNLANKKKRDDTESFFPAQQRAAHVRPRVPTPAAVCRLAKPASASDFDTQS